GAAVVLERDDPHVREAGRRLLQPGEGPVGGAVVDGQQLVGLAAGVHRLADALDLVDDVVLLVVAGQDDRDVHRRRRRIGRLALGRGAGRGRRVGGARRGRGLVRRRAGRRGLGGGLGRRLGRLGAHAARGYSPGRAGTATRGRAARYAPPRPSRTARPLRGASPVPQWLARCAPPRPSRTASPVARRLAQEAGGSAIQTSMARPQAPPGGAVRVRPSCRVRSSSTRDGGPYGATWSAVAAMITGRRPAARTLPATRRTSSCVAPSAARAAGGPHIPRTTCRNRSAVERSTTTTELRGPSAPHIPSTAATSCCSVLVTRSPPDVSAIRTSVSPTPATATVRVTRGE